MRTVSISRLVLLFLVPLLASAALLATHAAAAQAASCGNPVQCENELPGDPPSDWEVQGAGDPSIQGYATSMSVNVGQTISFKIDTPSTSYHIDILRLGWYGGDGARKVASDILPTATLPQTQPACDVSTSTAEVDCGNWSVSASWTVPSNAVSGVYIAHLVRDDSQDRGGDSLIPFVVRNDASHSDILVPTDDETWEAYNDYGGNNLYSCTIDCPPGNPGAYKGAFAVSYNRPFDGSIVSDGGASYLWYAEYQMIQFLERNGYDVSYTDDVDLDTQGSLLLNHKVLLFSGHDEYWSGQERANVTAARNAGVSLAMFTGNEIFWKTRLAPSIDGSNTPNRTLVSYKETHWNAPVDPDDPPTWTGAWADPRFSPPADGGNPGNALDGQEFDVNAGTSDITVPSQYSKLRIWQNTAVAKLTSGQSLTLGAGDGDLGYEWDLDVDNGFRPPGEFDLSSTTVNGLQTFTDYGTNTNSAGTGATGPGSTETHHLTLFRTSSGALVFAAGTVQWSWGLDYFNAWDWGPTEPSGNPPDPNMQQFTVNLLSMMGVQPTTLISGLVPGPADVNSTPPTSTISTPSAGSSIPDGSSVTVTGSATAASGSGAVVAGVEISTDGGTTWHPATLTTPDAGTVSWSYTWLAHGYPSTTIETRAVDDSGNLETPSDARSVQITCPCSLWGTNITPTTVPYGQTDAGDASSTELGVQFTSKIDSEVTGVRFYKASTNTGTHVGSLWTSDGTLLAQATFTNETASGWQTVTFSNPVPIQAGHTYVAAYFAPNGHYSATPGWFYPAPAPTPLGGATDSSGPWSALIATGANENGLYAYSSSSTFPTGTYEATNYWVDPVLEPVSAPGQATNVTATAGYGTATVSWTAPTTGGPATTYTITPYIGSTAQPATTVTGDPPGTSTTLTGLTANTTYTFTVQASNTSGQAPASSPSNSVLVQAPSPPGTPTSVSAVPASSEAQVSWTAPTANGSPISGYTVTIIPASGPTSQMQISDGNATSATVTGLTNGASYTFTVAANSPVGSSAASAASSAVTPEDTLFDLQTPTQVDSGDGESVNLGVQFMASTYGYITGVRFYKAPTNTGTHVASLWSSNGTLLAQGTFTGETASGWQTVTFANPVTVTVGATYTVSYLAPSGHYSDTPQAFASAVTNGPLTAPANGSVTDGNGVYAYANTSVFPSSNYGSTNYWVDPMFQPVTPSAPATPGNVTATPASGQALVTWTAPMTNGSAITSYTVTPYIGSQAQTPVTVNSGSATSTVVSGLANGTAYTFTVSATNGLGTSKASSGSSAVTPEDTIFDFTTPTTIDSGDASAINLGVQFTPSSDGTITGIRFYKATTNTGTHVGSLWSSTGTLLTQGTFSNESASGWQTLTFANPVSVSAGTTYVASYFAPNGHYSATSQGLASAVTNGPLTAPASGSVTDGNGVYAYSSSSTFPTSTFQSTNYWVDVLFAPSGPAAPSAPAGVTASPASGQALVSWTDPPSHGSPITSYTVTPYIGSKAQTPVTVNNGSATSATITGLTDGTGYTFTVSATNGIGTGSASAASNAVTPEDTIFDFATPATIDSGDSASIEVGVKFTAATSGQILGIRFYKAPANVGTHTGDLWSSSGNLLATAPFSNETSSGWQTVLFSTPVSISAGQTYIASYFAPDGHYSATSSGLNSGFSNPPLQAVASTTSPNGVYAYSSTSTFPTSSFNSTNYWVDVLFAVS